MQPNQLSCLALGVRFLWGHLRFITSKGVRWFYWDIQRTRSTEPFQPVQLCKCVCISWALWGWTCRERNAACLMSSETDWTVSWTQKVQLAQWSDQLTQLGLGLKPCSSSRWGQGFVLLSLVHRADDYKDESQDRRSRFTTITNTVVNPCQSAGERGLFYFILGVFVRLLSFLSVVLRLLSPVTRRKRRVPARRSDRAKIKLFGSVTSLPARKDRGSWTGEESEGGVDQSIHHACAGLTQQKMEWWERPLGCKGPGNSNNIFWRLSDCPIWEADIWTI